MTAPIQLSLPQRPRPAGQCLWSNWWGMIVFVALAALPLHAEVSKEDQIKAAFLFNFTKFVEWPRECFADDTSPLVIAVLGANPFGDELRKVVRDRKVNGRDIVVTTVTSLEATLTIHLLFVEAPGEAQFRGHLGRLRADGVLTVGESDHFIPGGGIIAFTLAADKVRFEINQTAAEQARLKLSAQLLKLATVVHRQTGSLP